MSRAASAQVLQQLDERSVSAVCAVAEGTSVSTPGSTAQMLLLLDLLLAATEAAREAATEAARSTDPAAAHLWHLAVLSFVEVVHIHIVTRPDGRLYQRAMNLGERVVAEARAAHDDELLGRALHRLGSLNLDPYAVGRTTESFAEVDRRWQLAAAPGSEPMPEATTALARAEGLLREAATLRPPPHRGYALKALTDSMVWRRARGDVSAVSVEDVVSSARATLAELDDDEPQLRLAMLSLLRVYDEPYDASEIERLLERSLDEWTHRLGPQRTMDLVLQAYSLVRESAPRQALDLLLTAAPLARLLGEEMRIARLRAEVTVLARWLPGAGEPDLAGGPAGPAVQQMLQRASVDGWDATRLFAGLMSLAVTASSNDEEALALAIVNAARTEVAPLLAQRHAEALDLLVANLNNGLAVNAVQAGDWATAVSSYAVSLRAWVALELPGQVLDCLQRIADVVQRGRGGPDVSVALVRGIAPVALAAERLVGPAASAAIRDCCRHILGNADDALDIDDALFACEVAKGLLFATALYSGTRYVRVDDDYGRRILEAIDEHEQRLGPEPWRALNETMLLTDYAGAATVKETDVEVGSGLGESLDGLRARYDEHVWDQLLGGSTAADALWLNAADIGSALDARTAVISFFLDVRTPNGDPATGVVVITQQSARRFVLPVSTGWMKVWGSLPEETADLALAARLTAATREAVQDDPGWRPVSQSAEHLLATDFESYLGAGAVLEGLREQGIDHLCLVPHGPLHFYPLHLLGGPGQTLADDWIVTLMPNLSLFVTRRGLPAPRRFRGRQLTAFGLGFDTDPRLPAIPRAAREAAAVASVFDVPAVAESDATEVAIRAALEQSRFVHVSTHGRHTADAPAFQCLYVTPDDGSDGRLEAHELLGLDLRGLELLTLSACETGLGRFDASDNLRGLPGAVLLSGASTIVCTLWEVAADVAERFFVVLYTRLRAGADMLDAFRSAQVAARADFPAFRDWGAFYLAGDWIW